MMPAAPVILNNTPLVSLWTLRRLDLLRDLFGSVMVPPVIQEEFLAIDSKERAQALQAATWISVVPLANPRAALAYTGLDRGEAAVLALALERSARLVIIDEKNGRRYARHLGLPLTGTLGVLLLAKEEGLVKAVRPFVNQLQAAGLYLKQDLINEFLQMAGERA